MSKETIMRCRVLLTVLTIFAVWGINASVIASEPPFSYGLVQDSCAPWDGPAIDVRLNNRTSAVPTSERLLPQHWGLARATHPFRPNCEVRCDHGCGL